jgi:hypothetical protein
VQEYLDEIRQGEWSFVFLVGEFSHAVLKEPPESDFRIQNVTAKITAMDPSAQKVNDAKAMLTGTQGLLLYARVDAVEREGRLVLMELEINEPYLFLIVFNRSSHPLCRGDHRHGREGGLTSGSSGPVKSAAAQPQTVRHRSCLKLG